MFLKMVGSDTQPLRGIKKKVRIIFAVENLSSWDRKDYGKSRFIRPLEELLVCCTNP